MQYIIYENIVGVLEHPTLSPFPMWKYCDFMKWHYDIFIRDWKAYYLSRLHFGSYT